MLPSKPMAEKSFKTEEHTITPGSWWRLVSATHQMAKMPAPEHGLVLMMSEVRVIDGEVHTVVFHPHPAWQNLQNPEMKILLDDLVANFKPELAGEMLREAEISLLMNDVQAISEAMKNPPDPVKLLEGQKESKQDSEERSSTRQPSTDQKAKIPEALLPSQDVIQAQSAIEQRIAEFAATKNWLVSQTKSISAKMNLISAYQMEKVVTSLASISQETQKAELLLKNVQTMRLFLGEDMAVTPLLDGESAPEEEPLTLMQRMLFLDEEIFINTLLEGFSADQMDPENLSAIFSEDFSLVKRMLPYERCAAIVKVRRNAREAPHGKYDIAQLFAMIEQAQADQRIHILVRDGQRLSLITADSTTSDAERFFPSKKEIDSLFQARTGHYGETREIFADNVEYSDARAAHDQRALFYKRFLILMWGVHERTDVFGSFMPKGTNWLAETTHHEKLRFVHDEENILTDGRETVDEYVARLNQGITAKSRVIAKWDDAVTGYNAPSLAVESNYRSRWKYGVGVNEDISCVIVEADGEKLFVKAPAFKHVRGKGDKDFNARVKIASPKEIRHKNPCDLTKIHVEEGILCIDRTTIEDLEYYMNSRAARVQYLRYAHILNKALDRLRKDAGRADFFVDRYHRDNRSISREVFESALNLWRSGQKWSFPNNERQDKVIHKIAALIDRKDEIIKELSLRPFIMFGGIKSDGSVYAVCDTAKVQLDDKTHLPWMNEITFKSDNISIKGTPKKRHWTDIDPINEMRLFTNSENIESFLDRVAPVKTFKSESVFSKQQWSERTWCVSRGLYDARNHEVLGRIASSKTPEQIDQVLAGNFEVSTRTILKDAFAVRVEGEGSHGIGRLYGSLGVVWGIVDDLPQAWLIDAAIDLCQLAIDLGEGDYLKLLLSEVFLHPEKMYETIAHKPGAMWLKATKLTKMEDLSKLWISELHLGQTRPGFRLPAKDFTDASHTGETWQQALATSFTSKLPGEFGVPSKWDRQKLIEAASTFGVLSAPNAARTFEIVHTYDGASLPLSKG